MAGMDEFVVTGAIIGAPHMMWLDQDVENQTGTGRGCKSQRSTSSDPPQPDRFHISKVPYL